MFYYTYTISVQPSGSEAGGKLTIPEHFTYWRTVFLLYLRKCVYGCDCPVCIWKSQHASRNGQRQKLRTRLNRVWGLERQQDVQSQIK